jgi:CBS domain containing-hemolysin-like protein
MIAAMAVAIVALAMAAVLRAGLTSAMRTFRADALRDAAEGRRGADGIARLLENRDLIHPSINAVHSALLLIAAVLAAWLVSRRTTGVALATSLTGLMVAIWLLGDFLPRAFGRTRPRSLAYRLAPLLRIVVQWGRAANDFVADDDLEPEPEAGLDASPEDVEEERELIDSVLEFTDTIVREVMVPRADMITIDRHANVSSLAALTTENGLSRYPLSDGPDGDIWGMVLTKDVLGAHAAGQSVKEIGDFAREITFVPETKRASDLLREMQASKAHLAVVVDEFGDIVGLVSIEDLLEELVGEITDEHDVDEEMIKDNRDGSYLVDARADVSELAGALGVKLPDDEWDTVGGLVLGLAGRLPEQGEKFEINGLLIEVVRLQGRRVAEVSVRRASPVAAG